jgi:hypothetical protein
MGSDPYREYISCAASSFMIMGTTAMAKDPSSEEPSSGKMKNKKVTSFLDTCTETILTSTSRRCVSLHHSASSSQVDIGHHSRASTSSLDYYGFVVSGVIVEMDIWWVSQGIGR